MNKEEIIKIINNLLIKEFELEEKNIFPDARLKDDLGLESLDFVDIAVFIKKKFNITIRGKDVASIKTMENLYEYVLNKQII